MDYAHEYAEYSIGALKRRYEALYAEADKKVKRLVDVYMEKYGDAIAKKREAVEAGEISEEQYRSWATVNLLGREYRKLCADCAAIMNDANRSAMRDLNGSLAAVYAESVNYATYQIESQL